MSSLGLDLDEQINRLEFEWRLAYDASIAARAEFQTMTANPTIDVERLDAARERLERTEESRAQIMAKIERLEVRLLSRGG